MTIAAFAPLDPDLMKLQHADYRRIRDSQLVHAFKPLAGRILATAPHKRASGVKKSGGLYVPAQREQYQQEYGLICTVIKVGRKVDPEITGGSIVVVPWFAGTIMLSETYKEHSDLWVFGDSDVMLVHST